MDHPARDMFLRLYATMENIVGNVWRPLGRRYPAETTLAEYVETMETWRNQMIAITRLIKQLGRRCRNAEDPIDLTPVDEIPETNHIRLSNGNCWDIENLLDFIMSSKINGSNDAKTLRDYGSETIWGDADFTRIADHPAAKVRNFREWYENRNIKANALLVTGRTREVVHKPLNSWSHEVLIFSNELGRF